MQNSLNSRSSTSSTSDRPAQPANSLARPRSKSAVISSAEPGLPQGLPQLHGRPLPLPGDQRFPVPSDMRRALGV